MSSLSNDVQNDDMPLQVVVDSNVLIGILNPLDHWHTHSIAFHDALKSAGVQLIYFDCVITQVTSAAARRLFEKDLADEVDQLFNRLDAQIPKTEITWVLSEVGRLYEDVLDLMRSSGGELNFHDALIAIICREQQIPAIASYDADFDQVPWLKRIAVPEDLAD